MIKKLVLINLAAAMAFANFLHSKELDSSERFFRSTGFVRYWEQFTAEAPKKTKQNRKAYETYLAALRRALKNPSDDEALRRSNRFLTGVKMWDYFVEEMEMLLPNGKFPAIVDAENFGQILQENYTRSLKLKGFDGPKSNKYDDAILSGNFPYKLFDYGGTQVLRIPNVASSKEIVPEFLAHLRTLKESGGCHLYINFLSRTAGKSEADKVDLIQKMELDKDIGQTIFVLTLDKNTDFYWQNDPFTHLEEARTFKDIFLLRMLTHETFYLSNKLDPLQWNLLLTEMMDQVHREFFGSRPQLGKVERQDFMELCYLKLTERLMEDYQPEVMNISCKNTIDRGPSMLTLLYMSHRLKKEGVLNHEDLKKILSLTIVQPLILRNRPAHDFRVARLISAGTLLLKEEIAFPSQT